MSNFPIRRESLAPVVAFCILIAFALFVMHMLGLTKSAETEWTRSVYLFSGVEAIAFAAAGFFFGKEVHRERAEKAEDGAAAARKEAADAHEKAAAAENKATESTTKGKALAAAIQAKAAASGGSGALESLAPDSPATAQAADLGELAKMASQLFP